MDPFTLVTGVMDTLMAKENFNMLMVASMMENGLIIRNVDKENIRMKLVQIMLVNGRMR